jgi:CheY-like chemotaxis protein
MTEQEVSRSILVVDDNPDNLRLLEKLLTERRYKARLATNGERALATVHKEAPDLILLDIMMPGMDGFDVCRQLKADESTAYIPVIFISAVNETIDKVKAFSLGGSITFQSRFRKTRFWRGWKPISP